MGTQRASCRGLVRFSALDPRSHRIPVRRPERQDRSRTPGSQRIRRISSPPVAPQGLAMTREILRATTPLFRIWMVDRHRSRSPRMNKPSMSLYKPLASGTSLAPTIKADKLNRFVRHFLRSASRSVIGPRISARPVAIRENSQTKNFFVWPSPTGISDSYSESCYEYPLGRELRLGGHEWGSMGTKPNLRPW